MKKHPFQSNAFHPKVPERTDQYIRAGIEKVTAERKRSKKRVRYGFAVGFVVIVLFLSSVRMSPTFAEFVSSFPVGKILTDIVYMDRGLEDALEHDYGIPIGQSKRDGDLLWTIEGMTADPSRIVLFYTVENLSHEEIDQAHFHDFNLLNLDNYSLMYGDLHHHLEKGKPQWGTIDISFDEDTFLTELAFVTSFYSGDEFGSGRYSEQEWALNVTVPSDEFATVIREYPIDQTVEFATDKMTFEKATVYPTKMTLDLTYDLANTYLFTSFVDLKVTNGEGLERSFPTEGLQKTSIGESPLSERLHLESSYFHESERLYVSASIARVVKKGEEYVTIDLSSETLLDGPNGLTLASVETVGNEVEVIFETIRHSEYDNDNHSYQLFEHSVYNESKEKIQRLTTGGISSREDHVASYLTFTRPEDDVVVFKLIDYPTYVTDTFHVQIK